MYLRCCHSLLSNISLLVPSQLSLFRPTCLQHLAPQAARLCPPSDLSLPMLRPPVYPRHLTALTLRCLVQKGAMMVVNPAKRRPIQRLRQWTHYLAPDAARSKSTSTADSNLAAVLEHELSDQRPQSDDTSAVSSLPTESCDQSADATVNESKTDPLCSTCSVSSDHDNCHTHSNFTRPVQRYTGRSGGIRSSMALEHMEQVQQSDYAKRLRAYYDLALGTAISSPAHSPTNKTDKTHQPCDPSPPSSPQQHLANDDPTPQPSCNNSIRDAVHGEPSHHGMR